MIKLFFFCNHCVSTQLLMRTTILLNDINYGIYNIVLHISLYLSLFTKNNSCQLNVSLATLTNNSRHHKQTTKLVSDDNNTLKTVTCAVECNQDSILILLLSQNYCIQGCFST
ncbi:hypothetical protein V8G54_034435 [Vigna mungo]|uniref:Uncharacterized protein n=1 Tax=Vigna mungo TaxID=3915 RepID=A0AAQ3MQG6_VIGMU